MHSMVDSSRKLKEGMRKSGCYKEDMRDSCRERFEREVGRCVGKCVVKATERWEGGREGGRAVKQQSAFFLLVNNLNGEWGMESGKVK